jgi:hypothetical protein
VFGEYVPFQIGPEVTPDGFGEHVLIEGLVDNLNELILFERLQDAVEHLLLVEVLRHIFEQGCRWLLVQSGRGFRALGIHHVIVEKSRQLIYEYQGV